MATLFDVLNTLRSGVATFRTLTPRHITSDMIYVGNNAVVCRCEVAGRDCALKCYSRRRRNAHAIYGDAYFSCELLVHTIVGAAEYVDVVVLPWIEGEPMSSYFRTPGVDYRQLSLSFDRFALDILGGEGAHGDIKPENIVILPDGNMRLIDYDSAWLPGFKQSDMEEAGTPFFSHPLCNKRPFDKSIDDFSIALLSTMLAALSYSREQFEPFINADSAIYNPNDVVRGEDTLFIETLSLFERKSDAKHRAIARSLYGCGGAIDNLAQLIDM